MRGLARIWSAVITAAVVSFAGTAAGKPIRFVVDAGNETHYAQFGELHDVWDGRGRAAASGYIDVDLTDRHVSLIGGELHVAEMSSALGNFRGTIHHFSDVRIVGLGGEFVADPQYGYWQFVLSSGVLTYDGVVVDYGARPLLLDVDLYPSVPEIDTSGPLATWQLYWNAGQYPAPSIDVGGRLSLTEVPEASTLLLSAAGMLVLGIARRTLSQVRRARAGRPATRSTRGRGRA